MEGINGVIEHIEFMHEEKELPKKIKSQLQELVELLKNEEIELSLKIDKALSELDEMSEDINLPSEVRMDIYNLSSLLENIRS